MPETRTIDFGRIARRAGFGAGPDGKLQLPNTQEAADALARATLAEIGSWRPGDPVLDVVLTGAGPVWGHLMIAHALHGRARRLVYSAPSCEVVIWLHDSPDQ